MLGYIMARWQRRCRLGLIWEEVHVIILCIRVIVVKQVLISLRGVCQFLKLSALDTKDVVKKEVQQRLSFSGSPDWEA